MKILHLIGTSALLALAACGGTTPAPVIPTVAHQLAEIAMPTLTAFDLGIVDNGKYYLANTGNNAIDVFDVPTNSLISQLAAGAFAGNKTVGFDHSHNGPDGIVLIPGSTQMYAGDVNEIKIVDTVTKAVTKRIPISTTGFRVDEGCYDPDDGIVMFSSPEESPPFVSFVSTKTQSLIGKFVFSADTSGLEQCVYDPVSKNFLINNDGGTAHPDGQIDVFPAASIVAGALQISRSYALDGCSPGGLVLGPKNDIAVGCNPQPPLNKQITLILDRLSGAVLTTIPFGGEDAIAYDAVSNRYFLPAFFHQVGNAPGNPVNAVPTLGIVDASTRTMVMQLPIGIGAHSVAVDGVNHKVFVPHVSGPPGSPFPVAGVTVFSTN